MARTVIDVSVCYRGMDFRKDESIRKLARRYHGRDVGSGMMMGTGMRDLGFDFRSPRSAGAFAKAVRRKMRKVRVKVDRRRELGPRKKARRISLARLTKVRRQFAADKRLVDELAKKSRLPVTSKAFYRAYERLKKKLRKNPRRISKRRRVIRKVRRSVGRRGRMRSRNTTMTYGHYVGSRWVPLGRVSSGRGLMRVMKRPKRRRVSRKARRRRR